MRIVIVGPGAMGSFLGALLARRNDVTLVGRRSHGNAIRRSGLRITGRIDITAHPRIVTSIGTRANADLVIIATKSYDTERAMISVRPLWRTSVFATLQNGLDNPSTIARRARRVVAGATGIGVTYIRPGEVRLAGTGDTVVGPFASATPDDAILVRDLFIDAGIPTKISANIRRDLWLKVIVNSAINPLTALTRLKNGAIAGVSWLADAAAAICRESATISRGDGIAIADAEAIESTMTVARRTRENRSSMLQDVEAQRRTEVEAINGAIVRTAERIGIAAPLNSALRALVLGVERSWTTE